MHSQLAAIRRLRLAWPFLKYLKSSVNPMKQVESFTCPAMWQHCMLAQSDDHRFAFDSRRHNVTFKSCNFINTKDEKGACKTAVRV